MQQTKQNPAPARAGLFRRILLGEPDPPPPPPPPPAPGYDPSESQIFDARPITPPDMSLVYFRLERVEAGVKLIAETMKRAFSEVLTSIHEVREDETGLSGMARDEIDALVRDALYPLRADLDEVLESVNGFPRVLAAATDDLAERVAQRAADIATTAQMDPEWDATGLSEDEDDLPVVPFDLDPIDLGFDAEDIIDIEEAEGVSEPDAATG
jgi:hypothetical protein